MKAITIIASMAVAASVTASAEAPLAWTDASAHTPQEGGCEGGTPPRHHTLAVWHGQRVGLQALLTPTHCSTARHCAPA